MKQLEEKKIFSFDKNFSYKIFYSKPDKYKLLEEVGTPLLNTSFNDNGKPIISNVEDAYMMLPSLDGIVVNGVLITK